MTTADEKESVSDRLRTAIDYLKSEDPGRPLSVARVCAVARVNRGNIYVCHPDFVREITGRPIGGIVESKKQKKERPEKHLRDQIAALNLQNKALLYLAIEQQLKIDASQMSPKGSTKRKRRNP